MALSAISMNSVLADKEFVLSLHHKLHVSTCINKPNDVHKHNQSIIHSINQSFFGTRDLFNISYSRELYLFSKLLHFEEIVRVKMAVCFEMIVSET